MRRAERLSNNRRARTTAAAAEAHRTNLHHMLRRMDDYSKPVERRKNPWDTTQHPAMLLRRKDELPPAVLLEQQLNIAAARAASRPRSADPHMQRLSAAAVTARAEAAVEAQLKEERRKANPRPASARRGRAPARPGTPSAPSSRGQGTSTPANGRPASAGPRLRPRSARAGDGVRRNLAKAGPERDLDEYQQRITAAIIAERLYHEDDLRRFLTRAMDDARYAHIDRSHLEQRTREVAAEFFCQL